MHFQSTITATDKLQFHARQKSAHPPEICTFPSNKILLLTRTHLKSTFHSPVSSVRLPSEKRTRFRRKGRKKVTRTSENREETRVKRSRKAAEFTKKQQRGDRKRGKLAENLPRELAQQQPQLRRAKRANSAHFTRSWQEWGRCRKEKEAREVFRSGCGRGPRKDARLDSAGNRSTRDPR